MFYNIDNQSARSDDQHPPVRIGIIGTGFVTRNFVAEVARRSGYVIGKVLTRRCIDHWARFSRDDYLTHDIDALIDASDVVFEATGDPINAFSTIGRALAAGKPVVTLNADFHVTVGSHFFNCGLLTEAEGDQPGCLAALNEEAVRVGLEPLVYGNLKGFLNRHPSVEEMKHWAEKKGYRLDKVTSATDGTKMQIEQCLTANGLGATIVTEGMTGLETADIEEGGKNYARSAEEIGRPIIDYLIDGNMPHGVFISGRHDPSQALALCDYKMGEGPYYVLQKPQCLGHLEVFKTIDRVMWQGQGLLNNNHRPEISVAAVAKRELKPDDNILVGCGGFDLRGICVKILDRPGHLPIGLATEMRVLRTVEPGQILTFDDVELAESEALSAWRAIEQRVLAF